MAQQFYTDINLNNNKLVGAAIDPQATAPSTPVASQMYYNTTDKKMYHYDGSSWQQVTNPNIFSSVYVDGIVDTTLTPDPTHNILTIAGGANIDVVGSTLVNTVSINLSGIVPIANGGTGANTAAAALTNFGLTATATELNYVKGVTSAIQTQLNAKAPTASPSFTGTPLTITPATSTNNTQIASTAYVVSRIAQDATPIAHVGATGTAHGVATTSVAGFMSSSDKTDLTNVKNTMHAQNTDIGTSNPSFTIGAPGAIVGLFAAPDCLEIKNASGTAYSSLKVKSLYIEGETTVIDSNTVNIGDNEIVLNNDCTTFETSSDGGIAVKFFTDGGAGADKEHSAKLTFQNSSAYAWNSTRMGSAGTLVSNQLANKYVATIGNNSLSTFTLMHNFNTRDVTVTVRETSSTYGVVVPEITFPTVDTVKLVFTNKIPGTNEFTVTITG